MLEMTQLEKAIRNYTVILTNPKYKERYGDTKVIDLLKTARALTEEYLQFRNLTVAREELSTAAKTNKEPSKATWDKFNKAKAFLNYSHSPGHMIEIDEKAGELRSTKNLEDFK